MDLFAVERFRKRVLKDQAHSDLAELILADQVSAVQSSVLRAIPINMLLGFACMIVAAHHGRLAAGVTWFAISTCINLLRIYLCVRSAQSTPSVMRHEDLQPGCIEPQLAKAHLRTYWMAALLSGTVWAFLAALCAAYTSPESIFYLIVVCGTTAGAVIHGTAYARIPVSFITPTLLAVAGCLFWAGGFDHIFLAVAVLVYLFALVRSAKSSESRFITSSRIKNEATIMSASLEQANARVQENAKRIQYQASHDELTGMFNRAGFVRRAEEWLRNVDAKMCFMLLDLDGFKAVNDIFGHQAGDLALASVGRKLINTVPATAILGRFGGDEFALLYDPDVAGTCAEKLAAELIGAISPENFGAAKLGVSIGIYQSCVPSLTDMLSCADAALYAAKKAGRNQFRTFDDALRRRVKTRRDIERDLPQAMDVGDIEVWFQPIVRCPGEQLDSVEALLRWHHPVLEWIDPPDLIFIASTSGHAESLTRHILSRICQAARRLREVGLDHVRLAMNLSPRAMAQLEIDVLILDALKAHDISPSVLEIEVTEETTAALDMVQRRLQHLSDAGIRISIDDFGVGYSSLASLRHRYVRRVKIDRSFISGLTDLPDNQVLVQAVLNLGKSMNLEVVAEGVERIEEKRMLESFGCEFMQGYLLGRPIPADQLGSWISQYASRIP